MRPQRQQRQRIRNRFRVKSEPINQPFSECSFAGCCDHSPTWKLNTWSVQRPWQTGAKSPCVRSSRPARLPPMSSGDYGGGESSCGSGNLPRPFRSTRYTAQRAMNKFPTLPHRFAWLLSSTIRHGPGTIEGDYSGIGVRRAGGAGDASPECRPFYSWLNVHIIHELDTV